MRSTNTKLPTQRSPRISSSEAHSVTRKQQKKHKHHKNTKKAAKSEPAQGLLLEEVLGIEDKEVADLYFNRYRTDSIKYVDCREDCSAKCYYPFSHLFSLTEPTHLKT
jgi:hypothetical protein